jgi:hypothetical protein
MPAHIERQAPEIKELFRARIREKIARDRARVKERIGEEAPSWLA